MATPVTFGSLLEIDGVTSAVRWREAVPGKGAVSPPLLLEFIGDMTKDRASRLMAHAEAAGLAVFGISQLSSTGHLRTSRWFTHSMPTMCTA